MVVMLVSSDGGLLAFQAAGGVIFDEQERPQKTSNF